MCFIVGLFYELDKGIFAGVGVHVLIVLWSIARPKVIIEVRQLDDVDCKYLYISPNQGLIFPSVNFLRALVLKAGANQVKRSKR